METFIPVVNQMLAEFRSLLRRSPIPFMSQRLSQLLAINMFAVFNTSLKGINWIIILTNLKVIFRNELWTKLSIASSGTGHTGYSRNDLINLGVCHQIHGRTAKIPKKFRANQRWSFRIVTHYQTLDRLDVLSETAMVSAPSALWLQVRSNSLKF